MFNTNLRDMADNVGLSESKLRLTAPDDISVCMGSNNYKRKVINQIYDYLYGSSITTQH